jgi:signal transduction histidine kinase
MLDGLESMPRERLGELLESLQRGTLRLTRLIDNLLESVRIESGQLGIRRQPVALAQVVEDAEDLIAGLLEQRRQGLRVAIPDDLPVITGDAQRLTQVVTNLLANASKFGPEDSELVVGAERAATRSSSGWRIPVPVRRSSRALRSSSASTAPPTRSRTHAASASDSGS